MEHTVIPLDRTGLFPRLVLDYLSGREDIEPFFAYPPTMDGMISRLAEVKAQKKDNSLLSTVLDQQHGNRVTDSQRENLNALRADVGYTITTGHQLCLFGGPAYFIYKIISVITLAKKLTEESGEKVIPLFWLASEDHDLAEVDHCYVYGKHIQLETDHTGAVGPMPLNHIGSALDQLAQVLGESDRAVRIMEGMKSAYSQDNNMSQAVRILLQNMFGDKGLLILDADDDRLKRSFIPAMSKEIISQTIEKSMSNTLEMLSNRGERVQATGREINLFYMTSGARNRIVSEKGNYKVLESEISWSENELLKMLEEHPERFSPNILMRPVYQEHILPNLAYIGGPGELSYWLQLKEVFQAFDMIMPVLVLRDSFVWIDQRFEGRLSELGLELTDLFREVEALHREYAAAHASVTPDLSEDKGALIKQFDEMIARSERIDPGVAQYAKSERQKLENAVDNLEKKLIRTEKKKHGDALERITQLKERVLPNGGLEERKENYLHWYLPMGDKFFDLLFEASNPLEAGLKVINS